MLLILTLYLFQGQTFFKVLLTGESLRTTDLCNFVKRLTKCCLLSFPLPKTSRFSSIFKSSGHINMENSYHQTCILVSLWNKSAYKSDFSVWMWAWLGIPALWWQRPDQTASTSGSRASQALSSDWQGEAGSSVVFLVGSDRGGFWKARCLSRAQNADRGARRGRTVQ